MVLGMILTAIPAVNAIPAVVARPPASSPTPTCTRTLPRLRGVMRSYHPHVRVEQPDGHVDVRHATCGSRSARPSATCATPGARAVVLTGAGGDFCTGADLSGPAAGGDGAAGGRIGNMIDAMRVLADVVLAVHDCPVPVVAKVDGLCVGAGLGLALAADLTWCSDRARFSAIFAKRGPEPRLRDVVAAAPADRRAQGQGARLHGQDGERRRGRSSSAS